MDADTFRSLIAQSLGIATDFDEVIRARMSNVTWSTE
jgi:hypothetical protein